MPYLKGYRGMLFSNVRQWVDG